jgi:hypothetical protein
LLNLDQYQGDNQRSMKNKSHTLTSKKPEPAELSDAEFWRRLKNISEWRKKNISESRKKGLAPNNAEGVR